MKHLVLPVLLLTVGAVNAQLLTEDFDFTPLHRGFWTACWRLVHLDQRRGRHGGRRPDLQRSCPVRKSIFEVVRRPCRWPHGHSLVAGLEGAFEVTFSIFVPEGNSGYYNVQESIVPATAFECYLNGNGSVNYNIDGGAFTLDATYATNEWLTIKHRIDTDNDLMNIYFNDEYQGQLPYDGVEIGGVNFYAAGDGINVPTYFIDDFLVDATAPVSSQERPFGVQLFSL